MNGSARRNARGVPASRDRGRELEGRRVSGHRQAIGSVVFQHEAACRETSDGASDGIALGAAGDGDVADRSLDVGARPITDGAGEPRRLGGDLDVVTAAGGDLRRELEGGGGHGHGDIVGAVIFQHQAARTETFNSAGDYVSGLAPAATEDQNCTRHPIPQVLFHNAKCRRRCRRLSRPTGRRAQDL